jgi:hypothetical protein
MLAAPAASGFAVLAADVGAVFVAGFFDEAAAFALGHFTFSSPAQQLICP